MYQALATRRIPATVRRKRRDPARGVTQPDRALSDAAFDGLGLVTLPQIARPPAVEFGRTAVLQLQRTHGNRFVQRLIAGPPVVQRCGGVVHSGCACAATDGQTPDEEEGAAQAPSPVVAPLRLQRLTEAEKAEDLKSSAYAGNPRLESAFDNTPPLKAGESGEAVKAVQQGLIDDGFAMPVSTKKTGSPDGIYLGETVKVVKDFQKKHGLTDNGFADGIVGRRTMGKLDELAGAAPKPRVGPEKSDFEIVDKSKADDKNLIFFDKDKAAFLDDAEKTKLAAFAAPKDQALTLTGVTSEEEDPALASARVGTVADHLTLAGHDAAKVTPVADPAAGKGIVDYRRSRRVEVVVGGAQPTTKKCVDDQGKKLPQTDPCDADMTTRLTGAQTQALALLDGAIKAVSAKPIEDDTAALLDATFAANVPGAGKALASTVRKRLESIHKQVEGLTKEGRHVCGNLCHPLCAQGSPANNNGRGAGAKAVMMLCPAFRDFSGNFPADIIIHESAHGAAGVAADDHAHVTDRVIDFLTPDKALRNAQSFSNFCLHLGTGGPVDRPPQDKLVGMDSSIVDQNAARRTLARVEKLVSFCRFDIPQLYGALVTAQEKGSWFHKDVPRFGPPLMELVAPRFSLTPTRKPPTDRDRHAVAAIADRYRRMDASMSAEHTLTRDPAAPTSWASGPGPSITLGPEFFAAGPQARIDLLLVALARATPGISGGMVPEYAALVHDVERVFHA